MKPNLGECMKGVLKYFCQGVKISRYGSARSENRLK